MEPWPKNNQSLLPYFVTKKFKMDKRLKFLNKQVIFTNFFFLPFFKLFIGGKQRHMKILLDSKDQLPSGKVRGNINSEVNIHVEFT